MTDGYYQYEPDKSKFPAYHFRMSAYDLALYGVLYANNGVWKGKQIIPEDWVAYSTEPLSIVNEANGIARGILWGVNLKYSSFQHSGYGGHLLRVYPNSKMVFVHRVNTENEEEFVEEYKLYPMFGILFGSKKD
jgi:CubicO group peptidase (beta-lactamase class C family)